MMRNTYLVGFMGCGKTTVGEHLAMYQGKKFYDLDTCVTQKAGMLIPHIFAKHGEAYFRSLETACLLETSSEKGCIIATGGGVVVTDANRLFLKEQNVVFLNWSFETLYERIKGDTRRPLATSKEQLASLYETRQKWYEEVATYVINCENHTPYTLSKLLIEQVR